MEETVGHCKKRGRLAESELSMRMWSLLQLKLRKIVEPIGGRVVLEGVELDAVGFLSVF